MFEHLESLKKQIVGVQTDATLGEDCLTEKIVQLLTESREVGENKQKAVGYADFVEDLFLKTPHVISRDDVRHLSESPAAFFALSADLFEDEDTASKAIYYQKGYYNIIDVKTRNLNKNAQPPNIISAYKLAQMCAYMIENEEYDTIRIDYIGVDWTEEAAEGKLVCREAQHADLFRVHPSQLYINWAAGLQIQFHPHSVDQSWTDGIELWAHCYLKHFVASAQHRCDTMRKKFVEPFLKYI